MYKLYFESNNQAHVICFTEKSSEAEAISLQILNINTDSSNEIFKIDLPSRLVSSIGVNDDKNVVVSDVKLDEYVIEIVLADIKEQNIASLVKSNTCLSSRVDDKNKFTLYNIEKGSKKYSKVSVKLIYENYTSSFIVHCVPLKSLYDVTLDFGSEASQMLIKRADNDGAAIPEKLFHNILRHYWGSSVKGKRVYDQQDEDEKLFRSIFFKKEKGKMSKDFEYNIPSKKDTFFSFISKRTDILGERIPNIKISFLTGKEVEGGEKLRLHTGVILRFLHEALCQISERLVEANESDLKPVAVRFTLLLPNVMPQNSVSSLLNRLRTISNSGSYLESHKDVQFIDIQSCSESDASFLERMNKVGMKPGDRCLTIDIGKGTTDFSITQKLGAYKASSEFRSGFVGAGNAISYAIFDNCMQLLGGDRKDDLITRMLGAEPAMLYELDSLIEDMKHHWTGEIGSKKIEPIEKIDNVSIELLLDRIRSMKNIGDQSGAIKKMVQMISQNIIERLPNLTINKIVISGRAFKFKLLRESLEQELKTKFRNVDCCYDANSAKSGCLIGASSNIRLGLSSSIVGIPLIIDASSISDNPRAFIEQVGNSINEDTNLVVCRKKTAVENLAQTIKNSLSILKDIFGNDDSEYTNDNRSIDSKVDDIKQLMSKGKEYKNINSNSLIAISGRYYVPVDRYLINDKDKPFSIYFDGESFFLRHKSGTHQLIAATIQGAQSLCFESQFPYSIKEGLEYSNN